MILATIGPKTSTYNNIKKVLNYTDFLRINGSHATIKWHENISKLIKKIDPSSKLLLDIPGIKPRSNNTKNIVIKKNQNVAFYFGRKIKLKNSIVIPLTKPIPKLNKKVTFFSVSDGKYIFKLKKINNNYILGKSLENIKILPKQGINIPSSKYNELLQEKIYFEFLKKTKKIKFDAIGLSFVQSDTLVKKIRNKYQGSFIISKIENLLGLKNYKKIVNVSDAIMIDRGDLAAEVGDELLFHSINEINSYCKEKNVPIIIATENLTSMLFRNTPSKSEVITLGYYIQMNVDRIMLSEETATSKNWLTILDWLKKFLDKKKFETKSINKNLDLRDLLTNVQDIPLILFTKKGHILKKISNLKNIQKIFVFTDNTQINISCAISKKFKSYLVPKFQNKDLNSFINFHIKKNKKEIFDYNKNALLLYVNNPRKDSRANTVQIVNIQDFK